MKFRRQRLRRLLLSAAVATGALLAFSGQAMAAVSLSMTFTGPAGPTVLPGSDQLYTLTVNRVDPTAGDVTVEMDTNSYPYTGVNLGAAAPTVSAGVGCANTPGPTVTCTFTAGFANPGTAVFPLVVPTQYVSNFRVTADPTLDAPADGPVTVVSDQSDPVEVTDGGPSSISVTIPESTLGYVTKDTTAVIPVVVSNTGTGEAKNVMLEFDTNSSKVTIQNIAGPGTCTGTTTPCNFGTLAAGASTTVNVTVLGIAYGSSYLQAYLNSKDDGGDDGDTYAYHSLQVTDGSIAGLQVQDVDGPVWAPFGSALTETFTIYNAGPNAASIGMLHVSSNRLTLSGVTASNGTTCAADVAPSTDWICNFGSIASGASITVVVNGTSTVTALTHPTGSSSSVYIWLDTNSFVSEALGNDTDASRSTAIGGKSMDLDVSATAAPVFAGGTIVYTITVRNFGPDLAEAVRLNGRLLGVGTFASGTTGCTGGAHRSYCLLGDIASGGSKVITINASASAAGAASGFFDVFSYGNATDVNSDNNEAFVGLTVGPNTITSALTKFSKMSLAKALKSGVPATASCNIACKETCDLYVSKGLMKTLHLRSRLVGTGKASRATAGKLPCSSRFTRKAKRAIARRGKTMTVNQRVKVTGVNGATRSFSRNVSLKK